MKYAALVAWREFAENAKTKGFWIGIFLLPVIFFLMIQIPMWLEKKGAPTRYFVFVDQSRSLVSVVESRLDRSHQRQVLAALNEYARKNSASPELHGANPPSLDEFISQGGKDYYLEQLKPRLKPGAPPFKEPRRSFQRAQLPGELAAADAEFASLAQGLKPYLRGEKRIEVNGQRVQLSAAILVPADIETQIVRPGTEPSRPSGSAKGIEYWSGNLAETKLREEIEQAINTEIRRREFLRRGMDAAAIRQVEQTYAPFASLNPKKEAGKEAVDATDVVRLWLPSAFVYLLWIAIFSIMQMLLNNIIEEKSNRIIEVLLSSVTPGELMMGKLFGIAAVGLTMVGAWLGALFGILSWKVGGASDVAGQLLSVLQASRMVPMFSIYFLLGYLMYAAFIFSIGSVCNTLKEAQNYLGVITMIMMVPLMTMTFIPKDPNGVVARVLSWIPIYTPFTMMNRIMADPPLLDLIGTILLLLISTAAALWMASKVFRIGILRTGQPPKIVEMLRWATRKDT